MNSDLQRNVLGGAASNDGLNLVAVSDGAGTLW